MKLKSILTAFLALTLASVAFADSYTFRDGLYWRDGLSYTRTSTWVPAASRWSGGVCYTKPGYYSYSYVRYNRAAAPAISYKDPDFEEKLLDIVKQRDRQQGEIQRDIVRHFRFERMVDKLGLQGNFRIENYGLVPYGNFYGQTTHQIVPNARTSYGVHSFNSLSSIYNEPKLDTYAQYSYSLAKEANAAARASNAEFNGVTGQIGANHARVAEIIAKGQAASQFADKIFQMLEPNATQVQTQSYTFKVGPDQRGGLAVEQVDGVPAEFKIVAAAKCASCHNAKSPAGGFNVWDFPRLDDRAATVVFERIFDADPNRRMPRANGGGPGESLTADETRAFFIARKKQ